MFFTHIIFVVKYGQEIKNGICYQANTIGRRNHYAFKR